MIARMKCLFGKHRNPRRQIKWKRDGAGYGCCPSCDALLRSTQRGVWQRANDPLWVG